MATKSKLREEFQSGATDLEKWRTVIAAGPIPTTRPEELVAAIQDLGPDADPTVLNPLLRGLSDHAITFLRRKVGKNHLNQGEDIIYLAHHDLLVALFEPASADGKGFRAAYYSRLMFRLKDAIGKELRERRTEHDIIAAKATKLANSKKLVTRSEIQGQSQEPEQDEGGDEDDLAQLEVSRSFTCSGEDDDPDDALRGKVEYNAGLMDDVNSMHERIDVDRFLEANIPDINKRLAFRLYMDEVPAKSTRTMSIAKVIGIDESTVRIWIKETLEVLKANVGVQK